MYDRGRALVHVLFTVLWFRSILFVTTLNGFRLGLQSTQKYFLSLGMPICDVFGMSECTGPETFSLPKPGWFRPGSIGRALPGTELIVFKPDSCGIGEICWRGRNVFIGYFKNKEATRKTVDDYGFLHSGDLGYVDDDGFVYITGRIKELLITAGGENVAPTAVEALLKVEMPFISNCQVIGDGRRFLALLLSLSCTPDSMHRPTRKLSAEVIALIRSRGSSCRTTDEAARDPVLNKLIREGIKRANAKAVSRAQLIRAWRVIPDDFTQEGGELTPTLKLRRRKVLEKYKHLVDEMYGERPSDELVPPSRLAATEKARENKTNEWANVTAHQDNVTISKL
eukprot:GHVT01006247.1.p2 GENE.GHVT01006247.1~~GHVT01006247.1.p2  ORF type:complete len:340 (-),score=28.81 GHVT01006247.1:716-1735(-)